MSEKEIENLKSINQNILNEITLDCDTNCNAGKCTETSKCSAGQCKENYMLTASNTCKRKQINVKMHNKFLRNPNMLF